MPQDTSPIKGNSALAIMLVVAVLAVAGILWYSQSKTAENINFVQNANAARNENVNEVNANASSVSNSNTSPITFTDASAGISFRYPSYLSPSPNYQYDLISSDSDMSVAEVRVESLLGSFVDENGGASTYLGTVSVEFPGTFSQTREVSANTYGSVSLLERAFVYHATTDEASSFTRKLRQVLVQNAAHDHYLLISIYGENSAAYDEAATSLLSTVTLQ